MGKIRTDKHIPIEAKVNYKHNKRLFLRGNKETMQGRGKRERDTKNEQNPID